MVQATQFSPSTSRLQREGREANWEHEDKEVVNLYFDAVISPKEYEKSGIYAQNYIVDIN